MRGAIVGDVVGSIYERTESGHELQELLTEKSRFTDDTVCTIAVADAILTNQGFGASLKDWGRRYPNAGYGRQFRNWLFGNIADYESYGNGAPMRVSPCAWLANTDEGSLAIAELSAMPTHGHPKAVAAAKAVTLAIRGARAGGGKLAASGAVIQVLGGEIPTIEEVVARNRFDIEADLTVLTAAACIVESRDFVGVLKNAVACGGDVDTIAAIAGAIAEPLYGIPKDLWSAVKQRLDPAMLAVLDAFDARVAAM